MGKLTAAEASGVNPAISHQCSVDNRAKRPLTSRRRAQPLRLRGAACVPSCRQEAHLDGVHAARLHWQLAAPQGSSYAASAYLVAAWAQGAGPANTSSMASRTRRDHPGPALSAGPAFVAAAMMSGVPTTR